MKKIAAPWAESRRCRNPDGGGLHTVWTWRTAAKRDALNYAAQLRARNLDSGSFANKSILETSRPAAPSAR